MSGCRKLGGAFPGMKNRASTLRPRTMADYGLTCIGAAFECEMAVIYNVIAGNPPGTISIRETRVSLACIRNIVISQSSVRNCIDRGKSSLRDVIRVVLSAGSIHAWLTPRSVAFRFGQVFVCLIVLMMELSPFSSAFPFPFGARGRSSSFAVSMLTLCNWFVNRSMPIRSDLHRIGSVGHLGRRENRSLVHSPCRRRCGPSQVRIVSV